MGGDGLAELVIDDSADATIDHAKKLVDFDSGLIYLLVEFI
jgi:hypothetical protein